ncbi:MAG: RnfABCDGE type electron transport complex subunit C [Clostridiales bacterium]|nr:RnfABCDGE type electron transport complex subunit C [Clostridiales bacterium]
MNFSKRSPFVKEIMFERVYPTKIILPMKMHYGVPAVPAVKEGDYVRVGQCVGVPEKGSFSVPVHSGISGRVSDISDIRLPNGIQTPAVTIVSDMKRTRLDSMKPRSGFKLSASEAIGIIRDAGICGMGGEGIPTAAKLKRARTETVKDFLVNCLQSEPYSTSDLVAITEYPDYVVLGASACARSVGASRCIFLISENRKEQRIALANSIERIKVDFKDLEYDIKLFRERFPQGYYRLVARALYGKNLALGETIEKSCSAVLFNCSTMLACWEALSDNIPMMSRIVSVTGDASGGHNMLVPIGTPVSELLINAQDIKNGSDRIVWGNCLTGIEIKDPENTPVVKTTSVISVVRRAEVPRTPCIHCGLCSECCPMNLSPNTIYEMLNQGLKQKAAEEGARECISCGSCSYVCPAGINLTTAIASFAGEGRVIEVNSLLDNSSAEERMIEDFKAYYVGETSLLEDYTDGDEDVRKKSPDSIMLPFEKDKEV